MIWRKLICKSIWISDLKKSSLKGFKKKKKNLKMFWTDSWVIWFRKCFKNVLTGGMFMPHQHCDQPWSLKAMDCNLLPQNSHSPPYSYSPLFSHTFVTYSQILWLLILWLLYSLHHSLILCFESVHTQQVLSLRMVIGVCAWLFQEDNTSLVDREQHQKQALGVRTNGLRFMDPRQEDLEEKWL